MWLDRLGKRKLDMVEKSPTTEPFLIGGALLTVIGVMTTGQRSYLYHGEAFWTSMGQQVRVVWTDGFSGRSVVDFRLMTIVQPLILTHHASLRRLCFPCRSHRSHVDTLPLRRPPRHV